MEIVYEHEATKTKFSRLMIGETFVCDDDLYQRIGTVVGYRQCEGGNKNVTFNCLLIRAGVLYYFSDTDMVRKVDVCVTVTG